MAHVLHSRFHVEGFRRKLGTGPSFGGRRPPQLFERSGTSFPLWGFFTGKHKGVYYHEIQGERMNCGETRSPGDRSNCVICAGGKYGKSKEETFIHAKACTSWMSRFATVTRWRFSARSNQSKNVHSQKCLVKECLAKS